MDKYYSFRDCSGVTEFRPKRDMRFIVSEGFAGGGNNEFACFSISGITRCIAVPLRKVILTYHSPGEGIFE